MCQLSPAQCFGKQAREALVLPVKMCNKKPGNTTFSSASQWPANLAFVNEI
ncbi:hypothetical protein I79_023653 [Cricetulus griseus]|uniref:Uncharacterized protein n=1 Tax=Cricetulus griseus TaxID=10029 RepID=G3III2_CRIGR|nr:hypothetical protein I79_023653 [Cricetulus griseus]